MKKRGRKTIKRNKQEVIKLNRARKQAHYNAKIGGAQNRVNRVQADSMGIETRPYSSHYYERNPSYLDKDPNSRKSDKTIEKEQ